MVAEVLSGMIQGIQGELVVVQTDISDGLPVFNMIGHLSAETKEAKERVRTALKNTGFHLPPRRISVNLAPADLRKTGSRYDLAIAIGLFSAMGLLPEEKIRGIVFLGELALDGAISPLTGVLPILKCAFESGCRRCIIPAENVEEASILNGMEIRGFHTLKEVFLFLSGEEPEHVYLAADREDFVADRVEERDWEIPDLSEVKGQQVAKRALEIAVAGCHNLFLDGPPGAGKSMLASCVPGLMPDMSREEMMECTMIYSVRGLLGEGRSIVTRRPFRTPSCSATAAGIFGGGQNPRPGEVTLAHHGVLFLDEFPEFKKEVIEMFRIPLEEHHVVQTRNGRTVTFPADFVLIAAANPCPCGHYPDRGACTCTWNQIAAYQSRLSGPVLDRLDLFVRCDKISYQALTGEPEGESSAVVKERISRVWKLQEERLGSGIRFNGRMRQKDIEIYCGLDGGSRRLMEKVFDSLRLTGRSYHRLLKTARTIADLDGEENIRLEHLQEALLYRRASFASQQP